MSGNKEIIKDVTYIQWIKDLKERVKRSQLKAAVAVNTALLEFYWELGADIVEKQKTAQWGSGFLSNLSLDLMSEFPDMKGFSLRNIKYIRRWVLFYSKLDLKGQQPVAQFARQPATQLFSIPWGHNIVIISKCKTTSEAWFYVSKTIENNWSRSVLTHQIESNLFKRDGKAISNFNKTLPKPDSDLARQLIKDPYSFDFLALSKDFTERELEQNLTENITKFLVELGAGFAYMGRQVPIKIGEREFFMDLLFYHTKLHCYVVVELKTVDFEPEQAGKLSFYIKAVDMIIRKEGDNPTIGILLCKNKDKMVAEYSLSGMNKPIGVSEYQLTQVLPDELRSTLPSIEEIESKLSKS